MIFVIAVELLACRIREEYDLKGFEITLDGKINTFKISQLADDTTIFLITKTRYFKSS